MSEKKLKKIFVLVSLSILVLIMITSCDYSEIINKDEELPQTNIAIDSVHILEKFNYNDLSEKQKNYISSLYGNKVKYTQKGVEFYIEGVGSGKVSKIITSTWPENSIGSLIPKAEYGELDRIEYSDNWISIYMAEATKSDAKDYLKKLKKFNFNLDETKNDGDVMLEYRVFDELENNVRIRYFKDNKSLEIVAKKVT